ncbi:hypothetical protein D9M71_739860 [compost metagenome]|uniref:Uncharacterized protein n=1 Tax=Pseudomonas fluorescens TaxID=294 RepID=A0A5E6TN65_PSEFL|nr:hypothetical protein [Pseudomonas fluorescens]VVM93727.1 hypothetical protein PS673_02923 [Pseudomonas fluorescens]
MKLRALGNLSGVVGEQEAGAEFEVDAELGQSLIDRGIAERVSEKVVASAKPEKSPKE